MGCTKPCLPLRERHRLIPQWLTPCHCLPCEGRKSLSETNLDAVALAKSLSRKRPKGGQMSLQAVSAELAKQGFLNERGMPFNHKSVASMLAA